METDQHTSQVKPGLENPNDSKLNGSTKAVVAETNVEGNKPGTDPEILSVVDDEVLRYRINKLIQEKSKPSKFKEILAHPLVLVIVGFFLSALVGGYLTNKYSIQQQELASQRSFSDELNKIRIQKIGEVWEQIDKNEVQIDLLLDKVSKASNSNMPRSEMEKDVESIVSHVDEDLKVVSKNRFWLEEKIYNQIKDYLDIYGRYTLGKLVGNPDTELNEILKQRQQAKQNILQIRSMLLNGEPEPSK